MRRNVWRHLGFLEGVHEDRLTKVRYNVQCYALLPNSIILVILSHLKLSAKISHELEIETEFCTTHVFCGICARCVQLLYKPNEDNFRTCEHRCVIVLVSYCFGRNFEVYTRFVFDPQQITQIPHKSRIALPYKHSKLAEIA